MCATLSRRTRRIFALFTALANGLGRKAAMAISASAFTRKLGVSGQSRSSRNATLKSLARSKDPKKMVSHLSTWRLIFFGLWTTPTS